MPTKFSLEHLASAVSQSESFAEVVRILGAGKSSSVHQHIKKRIQKANIDYSHFTHRNTKTASNRARGAKEILVLLPEGSSRAPRSVLLKALYESGVEYHCEKCGLSDRWKNEILNLEIDHKDGNSLNNNKENLRFLCPNCHSQTESNFRSKAFNPYSKDEEVKQYAEERKISAYKKRHNKCPQCGKDKRAENKYCSNCKRNQNAAIGKKC